MEMYESQYVLTAADVFKGWSNYAQFYKTMMQDQVAKPTKNIVFITHTMDVMNEAEMVSETKATVKGSLKNVGMESYFTTVISSKKVTLNTLSAYENPLLTITDDDEILGFKYVFQTRLTKNTVNEKMRSHLGLWSKEETFIDNDLQQVLDRINEYYK